MVTAGFVAPYLLDTTTRFAEAAARLPGVRTALITCEPWERLPPALQETLAAHWRIDDALDPSQLAVAVQGLSRHLGPLDRLLAVLEQLQVPLAEVRDHFGRPEYAGVRQVAPAALRALGLSTGLSHMEWFRRPDGSVAVSEVGARPPGAQITSMLCYVHDFDLYSAWARLMIEGSFDPPGRKWAAGTVYLRGQGVGQVRGVHGLDALPPEVTSLVVDSRLPRPGQPSSGSYEGDGWITIRHPETGTVTAALKQIVSTVRVELG